MAWGGKFSRMTTKQRQHFLRTANRRLPQKDNPLGIPSVVMKVLGREGLPPTKEAYVQRLNELLAAYKLNGG